jgi:hypothetical protein
MSSRPTNRAVSQSTQSPTPIAKAVSTARPRIVPASRTPHAPARRTDIPPCFHDDRPHGHETRCWGVRMVDGRDRRSAAGDDRRRSVVRVAVRRSTTVRRGGRLAGSRPRRSGAGGGRSSTSPWPAELTRESRGVSANVGDPSRLERVAGQVRARSRASQARGRRDRRGRGRLSIGPRRAPAARGAGSGGAVPVNCRTSSVRRDRRFARHREPAARKRSSRALARLRHALVTTEDET